MRENKDRIEGEIFIEVEGADHVVARMAELRRGVHGGLVNALHDLLKPLIDFLPGPAQPHKQQILQLIFANAAPASETKCHYQHLYPALGQLEVIEPKRPVKRRPC